MIIPSNAAESSQEYIWMRAVERLSALPAQESGVARHTSSQKFLQLHGHLI
jgi:hypothetical protein